MMNGTSKTHTANRTHTATVQRVVDALNERALDQALGHFAPAFQGISNAAAFATDGHPALRDRLQRYLTAFPDWHIATEALFAGESAESGHFVTLVWQASATHLGEFMHIPPTGRRVSVHGMTVFVIEDDGIARAKTVWDVAGWLRCVGLLPRL
jgi:steroid delta-isomerase-like uncharacterized protein